MIMRGAAVAIAFLLTAPGIIRAQTSEELARDPLLFLATAVEHLQWDEAAEPVKIAGPLYFVGTKGLAVWLITTSQGHILLNTAMPGTGPMIEASIRKLGLKPEDIRIILTGHAHVDHVGDHAYMQTLSHARIAMIAEEVNLVESGGKTDFQYGTHPEFLFDPVTVDQVFHDGDTIKLGEVALTAYLTPGHTRGSTTFVMNVVDGGQVYTVVFPNGTSIDPGYRVATDPSYPGIADDYRRTLHVLEMLKPDIWLGAHTETFDLEGKRARATKEGVAAWVDPEGYRHYVAGERKKFEAALDTELGVPRSRARK